MRFVREQPEFAAQLRAALEQAGYDAAEFAPFFTEFARPAADLPVALAALQAKLVGPLGLLVHTGGSMNWFVTLAGDAPAVAPPAETHTISASQLQTLNRELERRVAERTRELAEANTQLEQRNRELERLALRDGLTGLLNRRAIEVVAATRVRRVSLLAALAGARLSCGEGAAPLPRGPLERSRHDRRTRIEARGRLPAVAG